jgi:hypothetical protein
MLIQFILNQIENHSIAVAVVKYPNVIIKHVKEAEWRSLAKKKSTNVNPG